MLEVCHEREEKQRDEDAERQQPHPPTWRGWRSRCRGPVLGLARLRRSGRVTGPQRHGLSLLVTLKHPRAILGQPNQLESTGGLVTGLYLLTSSLPSRFEQARRTRGTCRTLRAQVLDRDKAQCRRVDAVAQPAGLGWTVVENMPEMTLAMLRANLDPGHAVAQVRHLCDVVRVNWFGEAGPPTSAVELRGRGEQRLARDDTT